jgi:enamine deaminase RidA (YjgF/YER057c/UK114 family)
MAAWMETNVAVIDRPAVSMLFAESFRGANIEVEAVAALSGDLVRVHEPDRQMESAYPGAVKVGPLVYLSQQDGRDASGALPGDLRSQTLAAFDKAERILGAAGAAFSDIVHVLIWHREPASYEPLNEVRVPFYRSKFTDGKYPASTAVPAPLPDGELIRFEAVAWRP